MRRHIFRGTLLVALTAAWSAAMAVDPQICEERLKPVDERIASGNYSGQNVQMAQQMRDSIMQSCGFLDEATLAKMIEGFEQLLPTRSEAERQAYEETRRAEREVRRETQRAEREVRRAERAKVEAERQAREAQKPPVPAVLTKPPTGKTLLAQFIDRDDAMRNLTIHDWDSLNGNARVLYEGTPDGHVDPALDQSNDPNARKHYYVLEMDDRGNYSQHYVRELPVDRHAVVALRPGHDEVVVQWRLRANPGPESTLERWSISTGELLSAVETPALPWSTHKWSDQNEFRLTTTDGDVLFVGSRPVSRGEKTALEWLKALPDGQIVGQGILKSDVESASSNQWFRTRDGGAGLVIFVSNFDDDRGIESELETPIVHTVNGAEIKGVVAYEHRLLVIDRNGRVTGQTAALERKMEWHGLEQFKELGSIAALQEASRLTYDPKRYGEDLNMRPYSARGRNVVAATGGGYGVLLSASSPESGQMSSTADWLFEYSTDGKVRKTYLESASEHLGARSRIITATDDNSIYMYAPGGNSGSYVVKLDEDREFVAYGKVSMNSKTEVRGMLADRKGVWVIGDAGVYGQLSKVWLERIEFE